MSIIDQFLGVLAPYECLGCSAEGDLLCSACLLQLKIMPFHCYRCQNPSARALTCANCRISSDLHQVLVGTAYDDTGKELVQRLKFSGARAAARTMAYSLATSLNAFSYEGFIVPVPTAAVRARSRGYDQAKLLARELSRKTRLPYLDCLARSGRTRQLGTSRQQRLSQLNGAFRVAVPARIQDADILLVDDVLTTGATLEAAAKTLKAHGAGRIGAVVFARA